MSLFQLVCCFFSLCHTIPFSCIEEISWSCHRISPNIKVGFRCHCFLNLSNPCNPLLSSSVCSQLYCLIVFFIMSHHPISMYRGNMLICTFAFICLRYVSQKFKHNCIGVRFACPQVFQYLWLFSPE